MPDKQTWTIDKFDGGINNHADPKELLANQYVELQDVDVHRGRWFLCVWQLQKKKSSCQNPCCK